MYRSPLSEDIFSTTGGKFESKAGQHLFTGGATVNAELPKMPATGMYSMRFDLNQIFDTNILKNMKGEFKHEVRQFQKPYDNQQAEQISLMV